MSSYRHPGALFLLIPVWILAASCHSGKPSKDKSSGPVIVDVIIAGTSPIEQSLEANGTVIANEFVELHPEVSGRIISLNVPEGAQVQKGTVIARVNDADLRAQLAKIKAQLSLARKTEERLRQLIEVQGINQNDYDIAVNAVSSYEADLGYTQALIDKTVIRAPFAGRIGLRQVSPGAYVSPSSIIATLQQTTDLKIDFTIPEQYSDLVHPGSFVTVKADTAMLQAKIIAAEPQVIAASRNIRIRALLPQSNINPGAFVKVYLKSAQQQSGILIPSNCIIPNDKSKQVILVKNGKAALTDIKTGWRDAGKVAVTQGLKDGDTVVVTGVLFARDKAPLKVRSVKNS
jgi:membrane fusion protein, multidrug efflux system